MDLTAKKCVACEGGIPPLEGEWLQKYFAELNGSHEPGRSPEPKLAHSSGQSTIQGSAWEMPDTKRITRDLKFKDFKEAMAFVNKVAELAESEGHHPDIDIRYNKVHLELSTHAIGGLSENDFILATKINMI